MVYNINYFTFVSSKLIKMKTENKITVRLAICLLVLNAGFICAQKNESKTNKTKGAIGYMSFSHNQMDFNSLNQSLKNNGYSEMEQLVPSFGGGGYLCFKNVIIGGEGASLFDLQSGSANGDVDLSGGYGFFKVGYVVYSGKRSLLYPIIGFGGGGYDLKIRKNKGSIDFNEQLANPGGVIKLNAGGALIDARLNYEFFIHGCNKSGFLLGINAGYRYSVGRWKVKLDETTMSNAPRLNMDGFFVSITLGGGSLN